MDSQQELHLIQLPNKSLKNFIINRYNQYSVSEFSYATVKDFCDSADHLPQVCYLNGDLKNVQRPWMIKAILGQVPQGGKILEIGGGVPLVAGMLQELGYQVTLVDPYEGAGNGPVEYEKYVQQFPKVNIVRSIFGVDTQNIDIASFDCIYSISVLEHIPQENINDLYNGIHKFLRPKGKSIHCIDHVIQGLGTEYHEESLKRIVFCQKQLQQDNCIFSNIESEYNNILTQLKDDLETFYLSALGHYLWRGSLTYDDFPFRKVVSIQICNTLN